MTLGELQDALEQMADDIILSDEIMDTILAPDHPVVQALGELLADIAEPEYEEVE